ncbi:vWA domain-containing protein [Vibrio rarus]|uniref:vWA domain-containing protein n=1 Tax=Vibrio rarus TaxID=413403 RepID=UPI0021C2F0D1|nr:vWA domain-containing protein [Vibrio rarus]
MDMTRHYTKGAHQKGLAVLLTVVSLPFLLIMAGLAIDSGRAYSMQAKLFAAVDAAGIAAARAVSSGETAATAAAQKYFDVNISSALKSSNPVMSAPVFSEVDGNIAVNISATASMPTSFISLLGFDSWGIGAKAQTIRRPVDVVLVVDNSSSLQGTGTVGGQDVTSSVIARSKSFLSNFNTEFDRVAVVKYANGAEVPVPFNQSSRGYSSSAVNGAINNFSFKTGSNYHYTNTSEGFHKGLQQITSASDPAPLQVIVFFTDGTPTAMTAEFDVEDNSGNTSAKVGAIYASGTNSGNGYGLWNPNKISEQLTNAYYGKDINDHLTMTDTDTNGSERGDIGLFKDSNNVTYRRALTPFSPGDSSNTLWRNIQQASRTLPEQMAASARQQGIYVFTLGLGSALQETSGLTVSHPDPSNSSTAKEKGEYLLYRMANDPAMQNIDWLATEYRPDEQQGVYCYAETEDDLGPCFDKMLDVIIRLTL